MPRELRIGAAVWLLLGGAALAGEQPLPSGHGPGVDQVAARPTLQRRLKTKVRVRWDAATGTPRSVVFRRPVLVKSAFPRQAAWETVRRVRALYGAAHLHPKRKADPQGPHLHLVRFQRLGQRGYVHFEQRIGDVPVEGSALRVILSRRNKKVYAHALRGRIFRALPLRLAPVKNPAKSAPVKIGKLTLKGTAPRVVATARGSAGWRRVHRCVELHQQALWVALREPSGALIHRRPLGNSAGSAEAKVWKTRGDQDPEVVRLRDLRIKGWKDALMITDAKGEFPGRIASLPWGLAGPQEAISPDAGNYPSALLGSLEIGFGGGHDAVRDEATVFYHLVETRRWLGRYADLPGMKAALRSRVAAVVRAAAHDAQTLPVPAELGGVTYDHTLRFGIFQQRYLSRDATVITHERIHALLFDLGFNAVHHPVSEAICDYFSAVRHNTPKLGAYALGPFTRDLSKLRVYPIHQSRDPHITGWIFGGALWDARKALGDKLDRAVLLAAPGLGADTTLFDARDQILAAATSQGLDTTRLKQAFVRHGLADPDGSNLKPRIMVSLGIAGQGPNRPVSDLIRVRANDQAALSIIASDPEGKPVKIMTAGLEGVATRTAHQDGSPAMTAYAFKPPIPVGYYTLTVTAEDADRKQSTLVLPLAVLPETKTPLKQAQHTIQVAPNFPYVVALKDLLPHLKLPQAAVDAGLDWRIVGPRVMEASLDETRLYLNPTIRHLGDNVLELRVRPKNIAVERGTLRLTIRVGPEARINVFAPAPKPGDAAPLMLLHPPDRDLVMRAGGSLELEVHGLGLGDTKAELTMTGRHATLEPLKAGSMLRTGAGRLGLVGGSGQGPELRSLLVISLPEDTPSGSLSYLVSLKRTSGLPILTELTMRKLVVHVLPRGKDRPPTITAPRVVISKNDRAVFPVTAKDPEGGKVKLTLAYPLPGLTRVKPKLEQTAPGAAKVRIEGSAGPELHVYVRAQDAAGNRSLARVLLLTPTQAKERKLSADPSKGIVESLDAN